MIRYGFLAIVLGSVLGVLTAMLTAMALDKTAFPQEIVRLYTVHSLEFIIVAFFTGMAAAYASLTPKKSEQLVGVAISAALVPPLAFAGIALGIGQNELFYTTIILYTLSLLATSLGAMIIYAIHLGKNKVEVPKEKE